MRKFIKSIGLLPIIALGLLFGAPVHAETVTANEVAQLLAGDRYWNDQFGWVVAVDGDTALIGSPADDDQADGSGSVYVFMRDSEGAWSNSQKLVASNGQQRTHFGRSLALQGDTALIGSQRAGGTAYVFTRDSAGVWSEQQQLRASDYNPLNAAWFSYAAMALDGDTAIICAHRDFATYYPNSWYNPGSAYVFMRDGTGMWSEQQKLIASDIMATSGNDHFCSSVALDGNTAVIGSPHADVPAGTGNGKGAAYIFSRDSNDLWTEQQRVIASDSDNMDEFGYSVAVAGDQAVIGAPNNMVIANIYRTHHGAAYAFTRDSSGNWTEQQKMFASDLGPKVTRLGASMAMEGGALVIGAPYCSFPNYKAQAGAAYLFTLSGGIWTEQVKLFASDNSAYDFLGGANWGKNPSAVGLSGSTILAGAPGWDLKETWGTNAGAAYVFEFITSTPPVAEAGADQSVLEGEPVVTLDGSASSYGGDGTLIYSWTQIAGTSVTLSDPSASQPTFTAPYVPIGGETLTFELTVYAGDLSDTDIVNVTVVNVNHQPVSDAGDNVSVAEGSPVVLVGSDSFDEDGDALTYSWVQTGGSNVVTITGADTALPGFTAPFGGGSGAPGVVDTLVFELTVDDGFFADAPATGYAFGDNVSSVIVEVTNVNNDPTADAGVNQTINETNEVVLSGSGSDPDGDILTYSWVQISGPSVTLIGNETYAPSFSAPFVGAGGDALTFEVTVDDGYGGTATDQVVVNVQNINDPPNASLAYPSSECIWPPNHKHVAISILGISDPEDNATITIDSVTQDEPTDALGDGDTPVDAIINDDGTVLLRAERSGNGDGRIYHIAFTASDLEGSDSGVLDVCVRHSRKGEAVDSGEFYDSTQ